MTALALAAQARGVQILGKAEIEQGVAGRLDFALLRAKLYGVIVGRPHPFPNLGRMPIISLLIV